MGQSNTHRGVYLKKKTGFCPPALLNQDLRSDYPEWQTVTYEIVFPRYGNQAIQKMVDANHLYSSQKTTGAEDNNNDQKRIMIEMAQIEQKQWQSRAAHFQCPIVNISDKELSSARHCPMTVPACQSRIGTHWSSKLLADTRL